MKRSLMHIGLAAAVMFTQVSAAMAAAQVQVSSNAPAHVFLDGQLMGQAPLVLARIAGGQHIVRIQRIGSPEARDYVIQSPRHGFISQAVTAEFGHRRHHHGYGYGYGEPVAVVQPVEVVQPVQVVQQGAVVVEQGPVVAQEATPVVVVGQPGVVVDPRAGQIEREKVRTRNTLLGAALANEVLNKGNSKGVLRGVTLGGALLNEVAR